MEYSEYGVEGRVYTADEVMAAIRKYRDGNTIVYVDNVGNGSSLLLDEDTAAAHPEKFTIETLMGTLNFNKYYYSYLAYDGADPAKTFKNGHGSTVTALIFRMK